MPVMSKPLICNVCGELWNPRWHNVSAGKVCGLERRARHAPGKVITPPPCEGTLQEARYRVIEQKSNKYLTKDHLQPTTYGVEDAASFTAEELDAFLLDKYGTADRGRLATTCAVQVFAKCST